MGGTTLSAICPKELVTQCVIVALVDATAVVRDFDGLDAALLHLDFCVILKCAPKKQHR